MRALVIGAGGNRGAAGAGKLARLSEKYDIGYGVSTGALMIIPAILGKHKILKESYTKLDPEDVFDYNPFNDRGNIKWWYAAWRILRGKKSLADTTNLRKTIAKSITPELWDELQNSGKEVIVGAYNLSTGKMEYVSSKTTRYSLFLDYIWASASYPILSSIPVILSYEFCDGGLQEMIPFEKAISDPRVTHVSVIAHRPQKIEKPIKKPLKNIFHFSARLLEGIMNETSTADLATGALKSELEGKKYEIHYVSQGFGESSMIFNKSKMLRWWFDAFYEKPCPEKNF